MVLYCTVVLYNVIHSNEIDHLEMLIVHLRIQSLCYSLISVSRGMLNVFCDYCQWL